MEKIVQVEELTYNLKNESILQNINLNMDQGDFLALFGEDDAGKTTLLHLLLGFDMKYSGKAEIFGVNANVFDQTMRQQIRFVPDDILWEKEITPVDYFNFVSANNANYNREFQAELCEKYEIEVKEPVLNMTYRNNKLVQIIAAISAVPKLLILDEPVNFLDVKTYRRVLEDLCRLQAIGTSIFVAAEKYADVGGYCNAYAYMKEGSIVCQKKVPDPDYRWKIVGVSKGNSEILDQYMDQFLFCRRNVNYYLYCGDMVLLPEYLKCSGCLDCSVEELTLEEEINRDYARWELEKL